ncbi:phosphatase PAP2 family protein [Peristeroidobacter soli]|uniref:phosphatase PAP2 family protein n=1 Tax=Peristeroidobacter soli TaxID=2497877 RepID=UPI001C37C9BD|nr:phosphatase PAP2 family protein [Peristeroidobacter soli]
MTMTTARVDGIFRRVDAYEYAWCLRLNRGCQRRRIVRDLFAAVSKLGDGVFWYILIFLLPAIYGESAVMPSVRMAVVGIVGVLLYKYLKSRLVRERPYISLAGIVPGTPALDRYSFPSGHTLHAVSFTILAVSSYPELAWLLVPFATLVAASRVVLGLHYPTDVAAGAIIGATLATVSMAVFPV